MARLSGVDLPREKQIQISLTYLYGIGNTSARKVCALAQVDPTKRTKDLSDDEIHRIRESLDQNYKVEGDLRRRKGLPVRGQRTHTNARTRKGPKRGIVRRAVAAPPPRA